MEKVKESKEGKKLYLVRMYYTDRSDSYQDGNIPFNINGRRYDIPEDKEVWVPEEIIQAADLTERDVWLSEIDPKTGNLKYNIVRRKRVAYEILQKKRVKEDYEVDVLSKDLPDVMQVELDDEIVEL